MDDAKMEESTGKLKAKVILENLKGDLTYGIEDVPPISTCVFLGFQQYLTMFGATLALPLLLSSVFCMQNDLVALSELISTIFFVSGLATLLQTTFGCRNSDKKPAHLEKQISETTLLDNEQKLKNTK